MAEKVRLGGMALANGVLVHGPRSWAAAVRLPDGTIKVERDLMKLVPREHWGAFPHLLIWHGRRVCIARRPLCEACVLVDLCPSSRV